MFSVLDFGAIPDGKTLAREAFQAAVDACHAAGGGTVLVPMGTYLLGTIEMRSHVHILFEDGVRVLGSVDFDRDYLPREPFEGGKYQDDSHSFYDHSLFVVKGCCDVGFSGRATIDMQGIFIESDRGQYYRTVKIFAMRESQDIVLADLTLLRACDLAVWMVDCERVRIHGLSLDVLVDGISPDGCRDVVISDCIILADDDALVFKSSFSLHRFVACEYITVRNCIISSNASAIKIGTETNGDFRNISITGCTIRNVRRAGIALESADGANLSGIVISNITMQRVATPLFVRLCRRMRAPEGTPVGSIRDIMISNVHADNDGTPYKTHYLYLPSQQNVGPICKPFPFASMIMGLADHPIENLTLRDVTLCVEGGKTPEDALPLPLPEKEEAYPDVNMFGWDCHLPASCLFVRHVRGYREKNVTLRTHNPDTRPLTIREDVEA